MEKANGEVVTITGRITAPEIGDRVEVVWALSASPELEWAEDFQMADASERDGTLEWVRGGGPDVLQDTVRWLRADRARRGCRRRGPPPSRHGEPEAQGRRTPPSFLTSQAIV